MKLDNVKFWQICSLALAIVVIVLAVCLVVMNKGEENEVVTGDISKQDEEKSGYREIRLDEDLMTDGKVENLENVNWNNARITQDSRKAEISIMLNNESETEKIEARTVVIELLNKNNKVIAMKETQMPEIKEDYGYAYLETEVNIKEPQIVYNINIKAKQPAKAEENALKTEN